MRIRTRAVLFQAVIGLAILAVGTAAWITVRTADYYLHRAEAAGAQLAATIDLASRANRYSEQVAEYILIGEPEAPDIRSARAELLTSFDRLRQVTYREAVVVAATAELAMEIDEVDRVRALRRRFAAVEDAVDPVLRLALDGRREEAVRAFRATVENGLDARFEQLIVVAVADEQAEVDEARAAASRIMRRLIAVVVAVCAAAFLVSGALSFRLYRSILRPIRLLTDGALRLGRGVSGHRIAYAGGDEFGFLALRFNDMAAKLEEQRAVLLASRDTLETEVAARTREIATANLRLRDLDRLRVQFLADISHELRTPLTVMRGEAEVTLRREGRPEAAYREALSRVVEQAGEMGRHIDDLLFLARSETDTIRFAFAPVDVRAVAGAAIEEARVLAAARGVTLESDLAARSPAAMADARRLKQAFMIVLDNAVKYSEPGGRVEVRLEDDGARARFAVRDHGVGVPPETLPYVFDRFTRGRDPRTAAPGGSGLGLPIAKWIIDKHDGEITLTSAPGEATLVRLTLPLLASSGGVAGRPPGEAAADRRRLADRELPQARA